MREIIMGDVDIALEEDAAAQGTSSQGPYLAQARPKNC